MSEVTISYKELEALHDVLEAARCYWHTQHAVHSRAAETLQLANRLYWHIGEHLTKTGAPSKRFQAVFHSSHGDIVEKLLDYAVELSSVYSNANGPWVADTLFVSSGIMNGLSKEDLKSFRESLGRLGLALKHKTELPDYEMFVDRQNLGP